MEKFKISKKENYINQYSKKVCLWVRKGFLFSAGYVSDISDTESFTLGKESRMSYCSSQERLL